MAKDFDTREQLKQYISLLSSTGVSSKAGEGYADYIAALSALNDKVDAFFVPDANGKLPTVNNKAAVELMALYDAAIRKGKEIVAGGNASKSDKVRSDIATIVDDMLTRDMDVIKRIDVVGGKTLQEVIAQARITTVDLTGQSLGKVGGSTSVRMPFTYTNSEGKEESGYFTEKAPLQSEDSITEANLKKLRAEYPEAIPIILTLEKMNEGTNGICTKIGNPGTPIEDKHREELKLGYSWYLQDESEMTDEEIEQKVSEQKFDDRLIELFREYSDAVFKQKTDSSLRTGVMGCKPGAVTDARNTGMSIVADLLGVGDLIARSEPMKIIVDGREIEGTFMKTAQGKDINNIAADDPLTQITYEQLNQTKPKKQMSDLMVLDYICGNLDRHSANIFYQTDEKGNLTGIIGIDNDMSFPEIFNKKTTVGYGLNDPKFDNINAISEEMAERVMNLTPDILKASLRGVGLSAAELDTAAKHLEQVQERIARDMEYFADKDQGTIEQGHIRVVRDFSKVSLNELGLMEADKEKIKENPDFRVKDSNTLSSPLGRLRNLRQYASSTKHPSAEELEQQKSLPKGSELAIHEANSVDVISYKSTVTMMKNSLELVDPWNVRSSTEFKAMKYCLSELDRQLQSVSETPDKNMLRLLRNTYSDLARLSKNYINKKASVKNPNETTRKRVDMAQRINRLANLHLENFEEIVAGQVTGLEIPDTVNTASRFFDGIDVSGEQQETYAGEFANLMSNMDPYLVHDENNEYPKIDAQDISELKSLHEVALKSTESYLAEHEGNPDFEQKSELAYRVQRNLMKNYMALQTAKPGVTLKDVLSEADGRTVDVTGHMITTKGNCMSSRRELYITGPDGKIIKGFFTERDYTGKRGFEKTANKLKKAYPQYAKEIDGISNAYANMSVEKRDALLAEFEEKHKNELDFQKIYKDIKSAMEKKKGTKRAYESMLSDYVDAPIDTRNTAMSDIANLLGIGDLIAQSVNMKLKNGSEMIEGTFMYNAEGEDFAHLKKNNIFKDCKDNWMDRSPALRQMADLNVLDYLCMNVDRHNKNIIYQFDKSNPNNPKLIGIKGIDNDMSFEPLRPNAKLGDSCYHNEGIDGFTAVSDTLAKRIKALDPSMIKNVLKLRGLEQEHVDGVCARLANIKEALAKDKIPILTEQEFRMSTVDRFKEKSGIQVRNVFSTIDAIRQDIEYQSIEEEEEIKKPEDIVNLYEKDDNLMVGQDNELLDELKLDLVQATVGVHGGSKEFTRVQDSLKAIIKLNETIGSNPREATSSNIVKLRDSYGDILTNCAAYLDRKDKQNKYFAPNTKDGRRIQAVRKVMDFCKNRNNTFGELVKRNGLQKDNALEKNVQKKLDSKQL